MLKRLVSPLHGVQRHEMIRSLFCCVAALAIGLAGCQRKTDVASGTQAKVLTMSLEADPADLDPQLTTAAATETALSAIFEGLVALSNDGKTVLPGVADHWEISLDGKTYTFHLRSGVVWSNGDPLTARDFVFSFQRLYNPKLGSETAAAGFAIAGAEDYILGHNKDISTLGVSAPDDSTLVLKLAHPAPYLLEALVQIPFFPVHEGSLRKFNGVDQRGGAWTRPANLVSNGPFVLKEWVSNKVISVEKNPRYWDREHVQLNGIRFIPIEDELAEERAFRAGQLHVTYRFPPDKAPVYRAEHPSELLISPYLRSDYITFNVSKAPFDNPRVRRAFSLSLDRDKLISAVLGSIAAEAHSLTRDGAGGYHPPRSSACRFDPAEAKRLLAEAGYPDLEKFPKVEFMLNGNHGYILKLGEVMQEMWAKNLGIKVAVLPVEFKTYLDALRTKAFQLLLDDWLYSWDDSLDPLQLASTDNPNNDSGFSNAAYDRFFAMAKNNVDRRIREKAFDGMEEILSREVPYAPLYAMNNARLVDPAVQGWQDNLLNLVNWKEISLATPAARSP